MRILKLTVLAVFLTVPASAITLQEAQAEAEAWVAPRLDTLRNRVVDCVQEGNPRICHTAWAASVTPNTTAASPALATVTLDDPGRITVDQCDNECATGEGTYAAAGIAIPATAPVNAKINIYFPPDRVWSGQLVVEILYEGVKWQRGYGGGGAPSFDWIEVVTGP